ncbi:MAG TPA: hypothetical protein PLQ35_10285 [bacterium]|nr:hypothetical protein [bacterium]HQL62671.1 hypothetical protein [bacterium]
MRLFGTHRNDRAVREQPRPWTVLLSLALSLAAFWVLWQLRSWNLWNGDGEFCCKQTVGQSTFAITLSRCPLSHLEYRYLFRILRPITNLWVEDIIALSSCMAGVVYLWATVLLARRLFSRTINRVLLTAFCCSSMVLQVFCGHIEFYPWTCTFMMIFILSGWLYLNGTFSIFWPSFLLVLATALHSSAVFYFPGILALECFRQVRESKNRPLVVFHCLLSLGLFVCAAPFHRYREQFIAFLSVCAILWIVWGKAPAKIREWRQGMGPWLLALSPWLLYFSIRTALGFYAEPILHHIAPAGEPYDHGSFLYTFWSRDHLKDKLTFLWWLAPFAIPVGLLVLISFGKECLKNGWLVFLIVLSVCGLIWGILFYPQLRIRDWDLFTTIAIPFNLLVGYGVLILWKRGQVYLTFMILAHLTISIPLIIDNADLLVGRGYVTLECETQPVSAEVYVRGLPIGFTPLTMQNIRSGRARIVLIPQSRDYLSVQRRYNLKPGEHLRISETLPPRPPRTPVQKQE